MKKLVTFAVLLLLMVSAAACNGGGYVTLSPSPAPSPGENEVIMQNLSYNPAEITVDAGEQVTWVNEDSTTHTVTGNGFDSGDIAAGESYSYTFDTAGSYSYSCDYHPSMQGTVIVTEAGS